jgi:splicing factor 3B subunit 4
MIKLYGKPIKVNKASQDKRTQEVGANIFVGNLSEEVDEKGLKDIFSAFGVVLSTKIMRDPETGNSKRYGFVSYDNFDSSDESIKKLNGQYISGKPIEVSYAYKKDTKGERHGSVAERILAANRPTTVYSASPFDNTQTPGQIPMASFPNMMNTNFNMNLINNVINMQAQPNVMPSNISSNIKGNIGMMPSVPKSMMVRPPSLPPTIQQGYSYPK